MARLHRRVAPSPLLTARGLGSLVAFGATSVMAAPPAFADDDSAAFVYQGDWTVTNDASLQGGSAHLSTTAGSSFTLYFTGDKVQLSGTAQGTFSVSIDGDGPNSLTASSPSILFLQGGLARTSHMLVLTLVDGLPLSFDAATVTFHSSTGLTPAINLPPASPAASLASTTTTPSVSSSAASTRFSSVIRSSSSTSSQTSSSTVAAGSAAADQVNNAAHSSRAGPVAGGIIGALIALALLLGLLYFCRRARKKRSAEAGYWDSAPGRPMSSGAFVVGGVPVNSPALRGNERQRWSMMGRGPPVMSHGGVDQSPPSQSGGWRSYMLGAARGHKPDRLAETRAFYQVGAPPPEPIGFLPPPTPPPSMPLPSIPSSSAVAEMAEAHPSGRRSLSSHHNLAQAAIPSPARIHLPRSGPPLSNSPVHGSRPLPRSESQPPQSAFNPTPPSILPSSMRSGHLRRRTGSSEMTQASSFTPSISDSAKLKHRSSKEALAFQLLASAAEKKKRAKRTSYASQDDYYSRAFQERTRALSGSGPGILETLEEPEGSGAAEKPEKPEKPEKFWVAREGNISKYATAERDPRYREPSSASSSSVSMDKQWSNSGDGSSATSDDNSQEHILDSMDRKGKAKASQ